MAFDDKDLGRVFPTRNGEAQGASFENRTLLNMGGANTTKTKIVKNPDGTETMCRTRNGFPEFTTTKKLVTPAGGSCPRPPLTEINFAFAATQVGGNPYSGPTGYRQWYGDDSVPPKPQYNWSHDGVFSLLAKLQKRISFLDADGKKVDFLLAKKPADPKDMNNPENRDYDGGNTFDSVTLTRATGSDVQYRFVEGRFKYREWFEPSFVDLGWIFQTTAPAMSFLSKRLKKITLRVFDFLSGTAKITNTLTWEFVEKTSTVLTGHNAAPACSSQNARELSYPDRDFFPTEGHLRSLTLRTNYVDAPDTGPDIVVNFKTPGSFLGVLNPLGVIPTVEIPSPELHPGVDGAMDLLDFSAFGNSFHGYAYRVGTDPCKLYKDTTMAAEYTELASSTVVQGFPQRYYNFFNVDSLDPDNIVTDLVFDTGSGDYIPSDRKFYKDIIINGIYPFPVVPTVDNKGALTWNQHLYKDPDGVVWVIQVEQFVIQVSGSFDHFAYIVWLNGQYKDLEHLRPYSNSGFNLLTSKILYTSPNIGWYVGMEQFLFADCSFISGSYTYFYPSTKNSPDGKRIAVMLHSGCHYESIVYADDIRIAGTGLVDDSLGGMVGDGITATRTRISLPAQNHQSASLGGGDISHDREMVNGLFFSGGAWKYTSVKGHGIQNVLTPYGYSWDWTVSVTVNGTPVGSPCGFTSVFTGPGVVEYKMLDGTVCPGGIAIPSIFNITYWSQGTEYMRGVLIAKAQTVTIAGGNPFFTNNTYVPVAACNAVYVLNPAERSGQTTTIVFEDGMVDTLPLDDVSAWDDGSGSMVSSKAGFAYDYRSKNITTFPYTDLAQFI